MLSPIQVLDGLGHRSDSLSVAQLRQRQFDRTARSNLHRRKFTAGLRHSKHDTSGVAPILHGCDSGVMAYAKTIAIRSCVIRIVVRDSGSLLRRNACAHVPAIRET